MEMMTVEYQTTPFRAERFRKLYEPAVAKAASYGSTGHLFYRSEDDPDHFVHLSFWTDKRDFERYWFSREMQEIRTADRRAARPAGASALEPARLARLKLASRGWKLSPVAAGHPCSSGAIVRPASSSSCQ